MPVELLDISAAKKPKPVPAKPVFKPRVYDDGTVEVQLSNGLRLRQVPSICQGCGCQKIDGPFGKRPMMAAFLGICLPCYDAEEVERRAALEQERMDRIARGDTPAQRRYVAIVLATPLWRNREKIKEIYLEAQRMTLSTGIQYEVDHIYPVQSKFACGLHVHHNLQILEKTHNRSKKNAFPLFGSPCGVGIDEY